MLKNLTGRLEGIDKLGRHNRKLENSIEMELKEVLSGGGGEKCGLVSST